LALKLAFESRVLALVLVSRVQASALALKGPRLGLDLGLEGPGLGLVLGEYMTMFERNAVHGRSLPLAYSHYTIYRQHP